MSKRVEHIHPQFLRLARSFVKFVSLDPTDEEVRELAGVIQSAIDDWLDDYEREKGTILVSTVPFE